MVKILVAGMHLSLKSKMDFSFQKLKSILVVPARIELASKV